jgi:hypothetical protein
MDTSWAAEHLQTIRTLMERSALYRRALAPIMTFNGAVGAAAAVAGWAGHLGSPRGFIVYWMAVAAVAMIGSFLLVRRQALREAEPFWSPPTRRVTWAMLPPLAVGAVIGFLVLAHGNPATGEQDPLSAMVWVPLGWIILYGCAFHAAGFFMPRGMRVFGWAFVLAGCGLLALRPQGRLEPSLCGYALMGFFFGLLHLAYGVYLYFTEQRGNET